MQIYAMYCAVHFWCPMYLYRRYMIHLEWRPEGTDPKTRPVRLSGVTCIWHMALLLDLSHEYSSLSLARWGGGVRGWGGDAIPSAPARGSGERCKLPDKVRVEAPKNLKFDATSDLESLQKCQMKYFLYCKRAVIFSAIKLITHDPDI